MSKNSAPRCAAAWSAASVVKIAAELEVAITPLEKTNRAAEENKLPG
jgi:hypothetical protein